MVISFYEDIISEILSIDSKTNPITTKIENKIIPKDANKMKVIFFNGSS